VAGVGDVHQPGRLDPPGPLKAIEHRKEIEYGLLVNHPSEDLTGSQPRRTTGGARHFITTNVTDAGGTFTEAEWWAALRPAFRFGGQEQDRARRRRLPISVLNQFAQNKVQVRTGENTYGLNVTQFVTPFGTVNVMVDYLLEGTTLGGEILILDMDAIEYRYMQGRDTHLRDNIQAPDADTRKASILRNAVWVLANEQKHARVTNITG
jgi:hypothetical protein